MPRSAVENAPALFRAVVNGIPDRADRVVEAVIITAPELAADVAAARVYPQGFASWLKYWRFKNRESGELMTFRNLWPGQEKFRDLMIDVAASAVDRGMWEGIFALKAGKLGFTELECAWDGYVLWARRNARVHLFSKEETAAKDMLGYVKFGLQHMEPAFGILFVDSNEREVVAQQAGTKAFKITVVGAEGRDFGDTRNAIAYATSKNPAIDQSATHAHVDEWAHMLDPRAAWGSISTTIAPAGTCHIVTRGAGEHQDVENTWASAVGNQSQLRGFFAPWTERPDRNREWLEAQAGSMPTVAALSHYAAETPEDAFRGDEDNDFVPIELWDRCAEMICCSAGHYREGTDADAWRPQACDGCREIEETGRGYHSYLATHPVQPSGPEPIILGVDAGVTRDNFAVVGVTRHPLRHDDPAIRVRRHWTPDDFEDGIIDFPTVEAWLRTICEGGCALGHPQYAPWKGGAQCKKRKGQLWEPGECPACAAGQLVPAFNIYTIAYDPYQLVDMMQALRRDGIFVYEFQQGKDRAEADRTLYDVIIGRRLGHTGDDVLRRHISNAKGKTQKEEDSKLRMVKKAPHRPIDLGVAASMAVARCLYYNL